MSEPVAADLVPPMLRALFRSCSHAGKVTFGQPAPLMNMNQRQHWRARHVATKAWRHAAAFAALKELGRTPAHRARPPCFVAVVLPVPDARRRDPANYAPTQKAIVDGLVDAGAWPDDTAEWVTTIEPVLRPTLIDLTRARPIVVVHLLAREGS